MTTYVAYLSHPIGPTGTFFETVTHRDNITHAHAWIKRLVDHTRWAVVAPWLAYLPAVGNNLYGHRMLHDQTLLLERCDVLVQVGDWISPHMEIEMNHALRRNMPIIDLTDFGDRPKSEAAVAQAIKARDAELARLPFQGAWMTMLDATDIATLKAAQTALSSDPFSDAAIGLLQRIIDVAMRRG